MNPFEALIQELGAHMSVTLQPDARGSCLINFLRDELTIQIDLDSSADKILVGTQLGRLTIGAYRERVFKEALRANGTAQTPRGILAFSEKNDTLVLFQFLEIAALNGEKLHHFLQLFKEHAKVWQKALKNGEIPLVQEQAPSKGSGMFGLKP